MTTDLLSVRSSLLPIVSQCAAAARLPSIRTRGGGPEADLGTALHDVTSRNVPTIWRAGEAFGLLEASLQRDMLEEQARQVAPQYSTDPEELGLLSWLAWLRWLEVRDWFPAPQVERAYDCTHPQFLVNLTGHVDILSTIAGQDGHVDEVRCADWKTGRLDHDYTAQLKGYAYLALRNNPTAERAFAAIIWVREGKMDGQYYTREELDAWFGALAESIHGPEVFNPGPHCGWCPRGLTCPAKTAALRQGLEILHDQSVSFATNGSMELPADPVDRGNLLALLLLQARALESLVSTVTEMVRADVRDHGGSLPLSGGELRLYPQEQTRIDPVSGWDALTRSLTTEKALECVTISKTKIEEAVRANVPPHAPRGQKSRDVRSLFERLEAAGALKKQIVERLEIKRQLIPLERQP